MRRCRHFAADATAGIDAAAAQVRVAVAAALDPAFDRLSDAVDKVVARVLAELDPLFLRLQAIANIEIGDNFATIKGVGSGSHGARHQQRDRFHQGCRPPTV
jgi:hypothetical protein